MTSRAPRRARGTRRTTPWPRGTPIPGTGGASGGPPPRGGRRGPRAPGAPAGRHPRRRRVRDLPEPEPRGLRLHRPGRGGLGLGPPLLDGSRGRLGRRGGLLRRAHLQCDAGARELHREHGRRVHGGPGRRGGRPLPPPGRIRRPTRALAPAAPPPPPPLEPFAPLDAAAFQLGLGPPVPMLEIVSGAWVPATA